MGSKTVGQTDTTTVGREPKTPATQTSATPWCSRLYEEAPDEHLDDAHMRSHRVDLPEPERASAFVPEHV